MSTLLKAPVVITKDLEGFFRGLIHAMMKINPKSAKNLKKKILKAIYKLFEQQLLPQRFHLVANARTPLTREAFIEFVREVVHPSDAATWLTFAGL
jgi:hypothetical protein